MHHTQHFSNCLDRFKPGSLEAIGSWLQTTYVENGKLPCASLLIATGGETIYRRDLGGMSYHGPPLRPDALFRIYSMTKPLTSVVALQLIDEGRMRLDDPVEAFIPSWSRLRTAGGAGAAMTLADLLRHTSGLTYGFQHRTDSDALHRRKRLLESYHLHSLEELLEALVEVPLEFEPGRHWTYSVATDVLGWIVGQVSGAPLDMVMRQRLLDPLGMSDTAFQAPLSERGRLTDCYMLGADGRPFLIDAGAASAFMTPPRMLSGGGGLVSTMADYLKFCRLLEGRGEIDGRRLLSLERFDAMTRNQLPGGADLSSCGQGLFSGPEMAGVGFGYGLAIDLESGRSRSPGGMFWGGIAGTEFWVDPVEDLTVIFMTQLIPGFAYPLSVDLRRQVYGALKERRA